MRHSEGSDGRAGDSAGIAEELHCGQGRGLTAIQAHTAAGISGTNLLHKFPLFFFLCAGDRTQGLCMPDTEHRQGHKISHFKMELKDGTEQFSNLQSH